MLMQRLAARVALACALAAACPAAPAQARQSTVILVCAGSVAPDACTRDTALDIIISPAAPTPYGCMIGGLTTLSRQSEGGLLIERYAVMRCEGRPD